MPDDAPDLDDRRQSFGAWVRDYHEYRPRYPDALLDAIITRYPPGRNPTRALDLGAGTGLLAMSLRDRGLEVVALEPDPRMHEVLTEVVGPENALVASAEEIPLPEASVDLVVAAQMWHWVDAGKAIPEVARVLRPGGVFAVVWNLRDDRVDWVAKHSARIRLVDTVIPFDDGSVPAFGPYFKDREVVNIEYGQPMDVDRLVGLLRTHSMLALRGDLDETEAATRALVAEHPDLAGRREFELPYVCKALIANRNHRPIE